MAEQIAPERPYFRPATHYSAANREEHLGARLPNKVWGSSHVFIIHTLPAFVVFISIVLTLGFVILILSAFASVHLGTMLLHPNPFATYENVWPGQSLARVAAYALHTPQSQISCISGASPGQGYPGLVVRVAPGAYTTLGSNIRCMDWPTDGPFRRVAVAIDDNRVREVQLVSDTLQQDALLLYWGAPDAIEESDGDTDLHLIWEHSTYVALAAVRDSDSVVETVTLTARE